ncbi:MAG: sulfate permease [bacterium]
MFKPKLLTTLKGYSLELFISDFIAGVIVGIVALPLAIAFAIASGVRPEQGLYTAIVAGFLISALGGSRVQVGGPTGAFVVIVYGIIQQYGMDGLVIATILAGIILIVMGIGKFGSAIKFIPHPLVVGFTSGIAVIIFSSQIKDFLGLQMGPVPPEFIEKWIAYFKYFPTINYNETAIGLLALLILIAWPKITHKIPGSLIAIIVTTSLVIIFNIPVQTIGSRFGHISSSLPHPVMPHLDFAMAKNLFKPAFIIALLAGIESLLSAVVADGMIGGRHRSNMELVAQGVANIASPIFGGIPATGAIARTATNIKNGGRTPVAGIIHAIVLLLIMLIFGKLAELIPMATLASILIIVSYNMSEWRSFKALFRSPKSDIAILLTTFFLTVIIDLTVAIQVGLLLSVFLFMRRMALVTNVEIITKEFEDEEGEDSEIGMLGSKIPKGVEIYEINGPFFFGSAFKFKEAMLTVEKAPKVRIIRMRKVPALDATGIHTIEEVYKECKRYGIAFILSGVQSQPMGALDKAGLIEKIGRQNIYDNFEESMIRAQEILTLFNQKLYN